MSAKIQLRRDTLEEWLKVDPVIEDGEEVLVAVDSLKPREYNYKKLGNGYNKFSELPELPLNGGGSEEPTDIYKKDIHLRVKQTLLQVVGKDILPTDEVEIYRLFSRRVRYAYSTVEAQDINGYRKLTKSIVSEYNVNAIALEQDTPYTFYIRVNFSYKKELPNVVSERKLIPVCFAPMVKTNGFSYLCGFKKQKIFLKGATYLSMSRWGLRLLRNGKPITDIMPFRIFCTSDTKDDFSLRCSL